MRIITDNIRGALKVNGLLERYTFTSWRDFVLALPELLAVEVPNGAFGIVIGQDAPTEDDRDKIWYRRDSSGGFEGVYAFQEGAWKKIYQTLPGEIVWVTGNSAAPPDGFTVIEPGDDTMPVAVVNKIIGEYVLNGMGGYSYFAIRFSGY